MARKRKSGTGTIRQRKDGRWEGRAVVGYDDKGLPKTKNVLAKTKHECQEKLTKLMETVAAPSQRRSAPICSGGGWTSGIRPTSSPAFAPPRRTLMRVPSISILSPQLGKIPLCQLTQKDLQQFYAHLKKEGRLVRTEQFGKGLSDRWCECVTPNVGQRWIRRCKRT